MISILAVQTLRNVPGADLVWKRDPLTLDPKHQTRRNVLGADLVRTREQGGVHWIKIHAITSPAPAHPEQGTCEVETYEVQGFAKDEDARLCQQVWF